MRRGSGFLLGYLVVGTVRAFVDIVRGCFELLGAVFGLLRRGVDHTSIRRDAFEGRLQTLVEPYMPVLVQKRSKPLVTDDYGELRNERWSKELGNFMGRVLWPRLGSDLAFAERNKPYVCNLLDEMIAARQQA
jgi:hypothetical protein